MDTTLTFEEKKFAKKFLRDSKITLAYEWPEWAGWAMGGIGVFLMASVCFITFGSLDSFSMRNILLPGLVVGQILLMGGIFIRYMSERTRERKILVPCNS